MLNIIISYDHDNNILITSSYDTVVQPAGRLHEMVGEAPTYFARWHLIVVVIVIIISSYCHDYCGWLPRYFARRCLIVVVIIIVIIICSWSPTR